MLHSQFVTTDWHNNEQIKLHTLLHYSVILMLRSFGLMNSCSP